MVSALQQQQRQPGMKHSPSHPVGPKPHLDSIVPGGLNVSLPDIQTKGQIPGYGSGNITDSCVFQFNFFCTNNPINNQTQILICISC